MADSYEPTWGDRFRYLDSGDGPLALQKMTQMERSLNPRTVGQAETLLGSKMAGGLADSSQFTQQDVTEPSAVPHYGLNPQGFGSPTPPQLGQPDALTPGTGQRHKSTIGAMLDEMESRLSGKPQSQTPNDPLAPQIRPKYNQPTNPLQAQEGPPQTYSKSVLNPESPVNPTTRDVMEAHIKQTESPYYGYTRGMGGSNTYNTEVQGLAHAFMQRDPTLTLDEALAQAHLQKNRVLQDEATNDYRKGQLGNQQAGLDIRKQGLGIQQQRADIAGQAQQETGRHNLAMEAEAGARLKSLDEFRRNQVIAFFISNPNIKLTAENIDMVAKLQSFGTGTEMEGVTKPFATLPLIGDVGTSRSIEKKGTQPEAQAPPAATTPKAPPETAGLLKEMEAKGGVGQYEGKLVMYQGKRYRIRNGVPVPEK